MHGKTSALTPYSISLDWCIQTEQKFKYDFNFTLFMITISLIILVFAYYFLIFSDLRLCPKDKAAMVNIWV